MLNSTSSGLSGLSGPPHFVDLHVNPGESVSIQLFDGNETILRGPATITMISQHTFPPIPMPVQVPPGHMIQQIVDENGTLRHIILSALNNNGSSPTNTALIPQQQQQTFPYCCCCCYSCTGTAPTAPLPPPPPPPPPPQVHHNILAFPTQPGRRRINSRTFSPSGKRAPQNFCNNNTQFGKSAIRGKISSTAAASVDGVSKVTYANSKHTTPSDGKPYELNSNRVLVGKVNHNENCLSDSKHVLNNTCLNKESIDRDMNKTIIESDGSILSQTKPAPPFSPFSYTSLDERKDLNVSNDRNSCSHFDAPKNSPILLEFNLSSDPRAQQNIKEEDEDEVEQQTETKGVDNLEVTENNLANCKIGDQVVETSRVKDSINDVSSLSHEESPNAEFEHDVSCSRTSVDLAEEDDQIAEQNLKNSNTLTDDTQSNSCISPIMQDNHNDDNRTTDQNSDNKLTAKSKSEQSLSQTQSNKQLIDRSDSINSNEHQSEKLEHIIIEDTDNPIQRSFDENQKKESTANKSISNVLSEDENEGQASSEELGKSAKDKSWSPQRSPKHLLPQLQLLNLTYTSLTANTVKLKWTYSQPHSLQDQLYAKHYMVEMLNKLSSESSSPNCRIVHQGHSNNCRISHLTSQQQYSFRVRTTSEEHVIVSNVLTITTPEQQPISNKYNKKSKQQLLQQQIQQQQHQIHQQQLLLQQQQHLQEQQSRVKDSDEPAITSDQRCAILLLLLFTLFALIVAVLIQQLLTV